MPKKAMPKKAVPAKKAAAKKAASKPKATPTPPRNDARPVNTGKPLVDPTTGRASSRGVESRIRSSVNNSDIVDMKKAQESRSKRSTGSRTGNVDSVKRSKTQTPKERAAAKTAARASASKYNPSKANAKGSVRGIARGFRGGKMQGGRALGKNIG